MRAPLYLPSLPQMSIWVAPVWGFLNSVALEQPCLCPLRTDGHISAGCTPRGRVAGSDVSSLL